MFENGVTQIVVGDGFTVLGGDHHGVHTERLAIAVLDSDLRLAVGPEEVNFFGFANFGKLEGELVGELDGHRHQLGRFVASEAEHQALVAGASGVHAHGDVRRLALDGAHDSASFGIVAEFGAIVAYAANGAAHELIVIDVGSGSDFAGHYGEAGGDKGFAGDAALGILL